MSRKLHYLRLVFLGGCWWAIPLGCLAAPSVGDALKLNPIQEGVPLESPSEEEAKSCTIKAEKFDGATAWVIRDSGGEVLRKFADSDGDNVVDTWSYYRAGLEIYRDIDADHNGKADQYRWFHNAGTKWGLDDDEDGTIDSWKRISPEEAAEEAVEAARDGDKKRFQALLLTPNDIAALGLSKSQSESLAQRVEGAIPTFEDLANKKTLKEDSQFSDFGGLKPGLVPSGTQGSTKDLMAYESVWAMVKNGDQHQQMQLGTMVDVDGSWKLVDGPSLGSAEQVANGFFFSPDGGAGVASFATMESPPTEQMQEVLGQLEDLDQAITDAEADKRPALNKQRADLLLKLANLMTKETEREQWLRQLADMVSASAQDGSFPDGIEYLKKLEEQLAEQVESKDLSEDVLVYFKFHRMLSEYYGVTLADPKVDYAKAQAQWMKDLEAFIEAYPKSENGAEVLRQLAMGSEMSGDSESAVKWYRRILDDFADSSAAQMAKGAVVRLTSDGKEISLRGTPIAGGNFDLSEHRGKAVVIQYWTTTSEICLADHAILKELYAKYGGRGLEIVGVNLDYSRDQLLAHLKSNKLPWQQLYEQGGFDSRLATEMGVVTVPLMVLVDLEGKVVSTNIQAAELEAELKRLLAASKS